MRIRRAGLRPVLALCALALGTTSAGAALTPGDSRRDLPFGGLPRTYLLHVPPGYDGSKPVPLVVDIHGWSSNADQQRALSGMRTLSNAIGFLVAYPEGVNAAWNAKICCGNPNVDDVGFIRAVVADVAAAGNVDSRRVYATGLSNGGAMSHRLACDAADLFAAAAPMAFPLAYNPSTGCQPSRSIPVLTVMGITDMLVRYDGTAFGSAPATFAYWHDVDACTAGTPEVREDKGKSRCEFYTECANGVQVGLCSVTAQAFPGQFFDGHILYVNPDYVLAEVAWKFLSQFTLPESAAPAVAAELRGPDHFKIGTGTTRGTRLAPLRWTVHLGQGTWSADDPEGVPLVGGSWRRARGGKRSGTAALTTDAAARFEALVAARLADLSVTSGLQFALAPIGPIRITFDRTGAPTSLQGRWRILRGGASGPRIGRYELRMRRARS
jgi:polyhydroxybutyrate depolymerase